MEAHYIGIDGEVMRWQFTCYGYGAVLGRLLQANRAGTTT